MDEQLPSPQPPAADRPLGRPSSTVSSVSILVNVVSVGLGGLYLSTRSIVVTVVGAVVVVLLTAAVLRGERKSL